MLASDNSENFSIFQEFEFFRFFVLGDFRGYLLGVGGFRVWVGGF
jgi:hypothetical protein